MITQRRKSVGSYGDGPDVDSSSSNTGLLGWIHVIEFGVEPNSARLSAYVHERGPLLRGVEVWRGENIRTPH